MPKKRNLIGNDYKIEEQFIDRQNEVALFKEKLANTSADYNILMFYGVGGIGKSKMRNEISRIHSENFGANSIQFELNLEPPENRNAGDGILSLVDSCKAKSRITFYCFELAYAMYFKKKYPSTAYGREKEKLTDKLSIGLDIIGIFDSGIISAASKVVEKAAIEIKDWTIEKEIKDRLSKFDEMSLSEIEDDLPLFFAFDLQKYVEKHPETHVLFVIDTFEALNINENEIVNRNRNERWVQNIIEQFSSDVFPNCLFTIFGRDKLAWDDDWMQYVAQKEIKNFDRKYAREYLTSAKVSEQEIIDKIVISSKGYPFYLYLSLKTYIDKKNRKENISVNDFGIDYPQIIERFFYNLSTDDKQILRLMSIPNFYTREIFELLLDEFRIKFSMTLFKQFNWYSFIIETDGKYYIHLIMQESLLDEKYTDIDTKNRVNTFLLSYYTKKYESTGDKNDFVEKAYHACQIYNADEFNEWLQNGNLEILINLQRAGEQAIVLRIINTIMETYDVSTIDIRLINIYIDIVHLGGAYEAAVAICEKYLAKHSEEEIFSNKELLMMNIRRLHHSMFYKPVRPLIQECLQIIEKIDKTQYPKQYAEALFLVGGNLGILSGDFEFAKQWLDESMKFATDNGLADYIVRSVRKIADLYNMKNEMDNALSLLNHYVSIKTDVTSVRASRYEVYLMGTLGETYRRLGKYKEAAYCYGQVQQASEKKNLPGWRPHALLGKALILLYENDYQSAGQLLNEALDKYNNKNQCWGRINAETIMLASEKYVSLRSNIGIEEVIEETRNLQYKYNLSVLERIKDGQSVQDFYLFFL